MAPADKCESEQEYELRDNWWIRSKSVGGAVGGVAVFVVAVAIVALFVLCHVKGITILPPPPPPRQGKMVTLPLSVDTALAVLAFWSCCAVFGLAK